MTTEEQREGYVVGYSERAHQRLSTRRADTFADFFLSHLRRGMRLLDVGSGPGSITVDLAGVVAPGEVVGLDIAPLQVERARVLAAERGVTNVHFPRAGPTTRGSTRW
jgi:ubiquinone/menaquinone biosynthesis C-methylase UbiE